IVTGIHFHGTIILFDPPSRGCFSPLEIVCGATHGIAEHPLTATMRAVRMPGVQLSMDRERDIAYLIGREPEGVDIDPGRCLRDGGMRGQVVFSHFLSYGC